MAKIIVTVLLAVIVCARAGEQDVLDLGDDDFTTRLAETETTLVMFYAPWCGHCKRLKPEYAKAAELLRDDDPPIVLAKVDCTEAGKTTCSNNGVNGYPTLKIFKNGEYSQDYNGPREAPGIVKYMRAQVGPASKDLVNLADFKKYLESTDTTIIGFFAKESDLKTVFQKYSDKMREKLRFGHTSSPAVLSQEDETDAIVIYRAPHLQNKFEPSSVKFTGKTIGELTEFVQANLHGLVGHRTRDAAQEFKNPLVVAYYAIDYVKNVKGTNYWRNRILKVAKEFEGRINFAISAKDDFQHEINEYGYDYTGEKPLILAKDAKGLKFIMKDDFSVENLKEFVTNLEEGSLEPYIKSEAIPENNDAPVKIAVANNFNDLVANSDKDILIEFYAPWCGHCKKLTPIYEEAAEKLVGENVALVKMDATANDVPQPFEVRGFPTLFWLPKDSKDKPQAYEGGREVDDIIKFIAKHATDELNGFDRNGNPKVKDEL